MSEESERENEESKDSEKEMEESERESGRESECKYINKRAEKAEIYIYHTYT